MSAPRAKKWKYHELKVLVPMWRDFQHELIQTKRNKGVYMKMAEQLMFYGVTRSWLEIKSKIKNLTYQYRRLRNEHSTNGGNPPDWIFYSAVGNILATRHMYVDQVSPEIEVSEIYPMKQEQDSEGSQVSGDEIVPEDNEGPKDSDDQSIHSTQSTSSQSHTANPLITNQSLVINRIPVISQRYLEARQNEKKRKATRSPGRFEQILSEFKKCSSLMEQNDRQILQLIEEGNRLAKEQNEIHKEHNEILRQYLSSCTKQ